MGHSKPSLVMAHVFYTDTIWTFKAEYEVNHILNKEFQIPNKEPHS